MLEKTFGVKQANTIYKDRIGAYGIGFSVDGKIPVVKTHLYNGEDGYFLFGGGIEDNENHIDCIIRETLEEGGLSVVPKELICKGDYYHFIEETKTYFHGIGYFYYMEVGDVVSKPTEFDHYLVWLSFEEIKEKLFLPHQIWAVEQVYNYYKSLRNIKN